jgi:membrane protease YdiL (CAAX protease family)
MESFALFLLFAAMLRLLPVLPVWLSVITGCAPPAAALTWLVRSSEDAGAALWRPLGVSRGRGVLPEVAAGTLAFCVLYPLSVAADVGVATPLGPSVPASVALVLFYSLVWAPVVEELMFRGVFYVGLRSNHTLYAACILSSLTFMAGHDSWPRAFVAGLGFAALRVWRGSLVAPVVAHALFNAVHCYILLKIVT